MQYNTSGLLYTSEVSYNESICYRCSNKRTAKGYPDISLLEPIAKAFSVSVTELISENTVSNSNVSANVLKSNFFVCPICGNVIHSMGEAVIFSASSQISPAACLFIYFS